MGKQRGYRNDTRRAASGTISCTICDAELARKIDTYCRDKNILITAFVTELAENFFAGEEFRLMALPKEDLVKMILEGGKA